MGFKPGGKTALSTLCLLRPHHPRLPRPQQEQQEAARSPGPCKHLRTRGSGQGAETQRPRPPSNTEEGGRGGGGFPGRVGCGPRHLTSPRGPPPRSWRLPATPCAPSGHQHPPAFDGVIKSRIPSAGPQIWTRSSRDIFSRSAPGQVHGAACDPGCGGRAAPADPGGGSSQPHPQGVQASHREKQQEEITAPEMSEAQPLASQRQRNRRAFSEVQKPSLPVAAWPSLWTFYWHYCQ